MHKIALKAQIVWAALVLAGSGAVLAQGTGQPQYQEQPQKLQDGRPIPGAPPPGSVFQYGQQGPITSQGPTSQGRASIRAPASSSPPADPAIDAPVPGAAPLDPQHPMLSGSDPQGGMPAAAPSSPTRAVDGPLQAIDPQGNDALVGADSTGSGRPVPGGGPLSGDDVLGPNLAESNPLGGNAPLTNEGPLQGGGPLTDTMPLLGPGPLSGAAVAEVSGAVPPSGPLQGAAPALAGGPTGVGGPVTVSAIPDPPATSSPYIPVLQPPEQTAEAQPATGGPPGDPVRPSPPLPPPSPTPTPDQPQTPTNPPTTPCCINPPPPPPPPPTPYPTCQANASGCT